MWFLAGIVFDVLVGIFNHDDGCVHHGAHSYGYAPQAHDIGVDALPLHYHESDEYPYGQGDNTHESAAKMEEENDANKRHDNTFFNERSFQVVYGPQYKVRTVVNSFDLHSLWQTGLKLLQSLFHILNHFEGILTVAHDHDTTHSLTHAIVVCNAAPELRTDLYICDVAQQYRSAAIINPQGNFLNVLSVLDIPEAPNHELGFSHLQQLAPNVVIAALDGHLYFMQREVVGQKLVGIHYHLILLDKSADGGHLGHPWHTGELIA